MSNPIEIMNNIPHEINMIAIKGAFHRVPLISGQLHIHSFIPQDIIYHTSNMLLQTQFLLQFGSSQSGSCLSSQEAITIAAGFRTTLPLPLPIPARNEMKVQTPSLFPHNLGLNSEVYGNVFD